MEKEYAQQLLDRIKNDYNEIADGFARTRQNVWEEILFLFDYFKRGDRILDLGCGNARYLPAITARGGEYFGVDNSEELVRIAKDKYPSENIRIADALKLPFEDNFFDVIYSVAVLHHIPSKFLRLQFLQEAKRVLRTGGYFILTVWKFKQQKEIKLQFKYNILKLIGKSGMDFNDILEPFDSRVDRYYHCFSQRELVGLAKKAGFKVVKIGLVNNERGNRNNIYLVAQKSKV